jgi:hypothetical protein
MTVTGGSAALLLGGSRATGDVDFGLVLPARHRDRWAEVEAAVARAAEDARVAVQFSDDIDRWSSISVPASRRRTRPLWRVGRLTVRLLDPSCWAVYKLARYLEQDREDLLQVLRRERVSATALARLCGAALRTSPRSTQLLVFRRQVEHFFRAHGVHLWGPRFVPQRAIDVFLRASR